MNAQATPIKKSAKSTPIPATTNPDAPVSAPAVPNLGLLNDVSDMLGQRP